MRIEDPYKGEHACSITGSSGADRCRRLKGGKVSGKSIQRIVCWFKGKSKEVSIRYPFSAGWGSEEATKQARNHCSEKGGSFHAGKKENMNSILPTVSEAIKLHDVAHQMNDDELHKLAVKLLSMNWQPHLATEDGEQDTETNPAWDELPPVIRVKDEAACVTGSILHDNVGTMQLIVCSEIGDMTEQLSKIPKNVRVMTDRDIESRVRIPAYEMYLIKKDIPEVVYPESLVNPGDAVELGYFRKHGAYKFPVVIQKLPEEYSVIQIHKDGENVTVFEHNGNEAQGFAEVIDSLIALETPSAAVFIGISDGHGNVLIYDILFHDERCLLSMPLSDRLSLLSQIEFDAGAQVCEHEVKRGTAELLQLEDGNYLVRYRDETIDDLKRPFWFVYTAGTIRIGQPVPSSSPTEGSVPMEDCIRMEMPQGVFAQIHKRGKDIKIFVGDGGRNRNAEFETICSTLSGHDKDFIIECIMRVQDESGEDIEQSRVFNADISSARITAFCYDLLYLNGESLCDEPFENRYNTLVSIVEGLPNSITDLTVASDEANDLLDKCYQEWYFVKGSTRPLNKKVNENWYVINSC